MSPTTIRATLLAVAIALPATPASAQSWPERAVRVLVPNPPGVGLDLNARIFAERLGVRWGVPAIVENLPGADGNLAARDFAGRRDPRALLYSFPGLITINPWLYEKLPYDPARDLVPIASTSDNFLAIAVSTALHVESLAELESLARSRSNKLNWAATPGLPYFAFAGLEKRAGLDMVHVPYRTFSQAVSDLIEGRIDVIASGLGPLLPHARAGKIKLLAFFNDRRSLIAPEVPTVAEAGHGDLTFAGITGFFGPRDIPSEQRDRIARDIQAVATETTIGERLAAMGSAVRFAAPAEFAAMIEDQRAKVAALAKIVDVRPGK